MIMKVEQPGFRIDDVMEPAYRADWTWPEHMVHIWEAISPQPHLRVS